MITTYSKKAYRAFLSKELKEYEASIADLTEQERKGLHEWVGNGNRVVENPCCYCDESGRPMDYISAVRLDEDIIGYFERFGFPACAEKEIPEDADAGVPF